ncbi:50S ribosomal protein L32 [Candidatus Epulonipiscium viviparus]|uniref:50S ribosomal protein L32 n=1 Tax=Candidatus Epulonipiscium viviparus TaxID=420336 RepID=UPI00016C0742|nr:50S ribosomal protein L32 [Candidatus Epulopiscium viviparus]
MAVPKRKTSKARRNSRKANWKLSPLNLAPCSKCGELMLPHYVCKVCGSYAGREVIKVN